MIWALIVYDKKSPSNLSKVYVSKNVTEEIMSKDNKHPRDLREALSVTPLLHMIPKQDIAPLISPHALLQLPDDSFIDHMILNGLNQSQRDAINQDPRRFGEALSFVTDDFTNFHDDELNEIKFSLTGCTTINGVDENKTHVPLSNLISDLPPMESNVFLAAEEVQPSSLIAVNYPSISELSRSRLSVRKDYNGTIESSIKHNLRYASKYRKELHISGPSQYTESTLTQSSSHSVGTNKRSFEDKGSEESFELKKPHRSTYISEGTAVDNALLSFSTILTEILATEQDTADKNPNWMQLDEIRAPTISAILPIYDCMYRIAQHQVKDQTTIEKTLKFQVICSRILKQVKDRNWSELHSFLTQDTRSFESTTFFVQKFFEDCLLFNTISKIMMKILLGNWSEKQMFLNEYYHEVVDLTYRLIDEVIKPFAVQCSHPLQEAKILKPFISALVSDLGSIIEMLTDYTSQNVIDESLSTKMEYLCIVLIFLDGRKKEKMAVLGSESLEKLKSASFELVVSIFKSSENQRRFILNEILTNFDMLPTQKNISRQYKLTKGGNVQLVTALLVKLIEASADLNSLSEISWDDLKSQTESSSAEEKLEKLSIRYMKKSKDVLRAPSELSDEIASFLLNKLSKNSEQHSRQVVGLLVEDLLEMITLPEFPASELLLKSVTRAFASIIQSHECPSLLETYVLEVLGIVGEKILLLKKSTWKLLSFSSRAQKSDLELIQKSMIDTISYMENLTSAKSAYAMSNKFLAVHFLDLLNHLNATEILESLQENQENTETSLSHGHVLSSLCKSLIGVLNDELVRQSTKYVENVSLVSYKSILLSQDLPDLYENFLSILLQCMDSTRTKSKSRAVKILSGLIEIESSLLLSPFIQDSISKRLEDSSPLVRDATIELVSKYLSSRPELIESLHKPICECINDDSVQVRKRVIRLSKEMYTHSNTKEVKVSIASRLLRRLEDEDDGVQDLAKNYLLDIWFFRFSQNQSTNEAKFRNEGIPESTVNIMVDLLKGEKSSRDFELFIIQHVITDNRVEVKTTLNAIVDSILEQLINFEDRPSQDLIHASSKFTMTSVKESSQNLMKLLSTFLKCDGTLLNQDQLTLLQPFITDEHKPGDKLCFYGLEILKGTLQEMKSLRPDFLNHVQPYLLKQLTKFSVKELNVAMPCVWKLSEMKNETVKLANATISCLKHIKPYVDKKKREKSTKSISEVLDIADSPKLQKLLHLLGCFGKYCDLEKFRSLFAKSSLGLKPKESVISLMIKFQLYFTDTKTPESVKNVSVINIINICSTHPKLFMSEAILSVIDKELGSDNLNSVHGTISALFEFLKSEDNDTTKKVATSKIRSNESELDVDIFHGNSMALVNDGICAVIVQRYVKRILSLCLQDSGHFSYLPIQFLKLIIKLGYANPKLCIPTIIALESNPNYLIKNIAIELHKELFEKHESLAGTSYVEAIKSAVRYRRSVSPNFLNEAEFLKTTYHIVNNGYSARKKFVQSLSKLFTIASNDALSNLADESKAMITYVSRNVANIKFKTLEEVLILIASMDKQVATIGVDLADEIEEGSFEISAGSLALIQMLMVVLDLRKYLIGKYAIDQTQVDSFRPGKVDNELKQALKSTNSIKLEMRMYDVALEEKAKERLIEEFKNRIDNI